MKKLLCLTLVLVYFISAAPAVLAADAVTYEVPKLDMTIAAPEGWIVFTQDVDENDPNLALLGADSKALSNYYKENNIYLNMITSDLAVEIVVTMLEDDNSRNVYDFNRVPEADMQSQAESLMQGMQELMKDQIEYSDCSIYRHKQAAFATFHLTQQLNGSVAYAKQYSTVINGKTINITLHSYAGEITDDLLQVLQNTVDSVVFTKVTSKPVSFDIGGILRAGAIGAVAGGIGGMIIYFIRKGKKKNSPPAGADGQTGGPQNTNI